ncbi:MAG: hypothetical protein KBT47_08140, partial [Armatimonadetes bacterium]|nr:hypothetical protein [Candidatus Hippobium faecium]
MAKKVYIGYDLGNAETFASLYKAGDEKPVGVKLPGANNNTKPILTGYMKTKNDEYIFGDSIIKTYLNKELRANIKEFKMGFKEKPSDLIKENFEKILLYLNKNADAEDVLKKFYKKLTLTGKHLQEIVKEFCQEYIKSDCPNKFSGLLSLQNDVKVFTDMIFENEDLINTLKGQFNDVSEIVFSVGYPSNWNEKDEAIYRDCFEQSIIGKSRYMKMNASLRLYKEAEAAYRSKNTKNKANCLIMDIGSSTIDVSWTDYKGEQHFEALKLGARTFEYIIKKDIEDFVIDDKITPY